MSNNDFLCQSCRPTFLPIFPTRFTIFSKLDDGQQRKVQVQKIFLLSKFPDMITSHTHFKIFQIWKIQYFSRFLKSDRYGVSKLFLNYMVLMLSNLSKGSSLTLLSLSYFCDWPKKIMGKFLLLFLNLFSKSENISFGQRRPNWSNKLNMLQKKCYKQLFGYFSVGIFSVQTDTF